MRALASFICNVFITSLIGLIIQLLSLSTGANITVLEVEEHSNITIPCTTSLVTRSGCHVNRRWERKQVPSSSGNGFDNITCGGGLLCQPFQSRYELMGNFSLSIDGVELTDEGLYTCRSQENCTNLTEYYHVDVFVKVPPVVTLKITPNSTVKEGTGIHMMCTIPRTKPAFSSSKLVLPWQNQVLEGQKIPLDHGTFSYQITTAITTERRHNGMVIKCLLAHSDQTTEVEEATLNILFPPTGQPKIEITPMNVMITEKVKLYCDIGEVTLGNPQILSILWYRNHLLLPFNDSTIIEFQANYFSPGHYSCAARNSIGVSFPSHQKKLVVATPGEPPRVETNKQRVVVNENVTLKCSFPDNSPGNKNPLAVLWYKDNKFIHSNNSNIWEFVAQPSSQGFYSCALQSDYGRSQLSVTTELVVVYPPFGSPSLLASSPGAYLGKNITIECITSNITLGNPPILNIHWMKDGMAYTPTGMRKLTLTVNTDSTGNYSCSVNNNVGRSSWSPTLEIKLWKMPPGAETTSLTSTPNDSVTMITSPNSSHSFSVTDPTYHTESPLTLEHQDSTSFSYTLNETTSITPPMSSTTSIIIRKIKPKILSITIRLNDTEIVRLECYSDSLPNGKVVVTRWFINGSFNSETQDKNWLLISDKVIKGSYQCQFEVDGILSEVSSPIIETDSRAPKSAADPAVITAAIIGALLLAVLVVFLLAKRVQMCCNSNKEGPKDTIPFPEPPPRHRLPAPPPNRPTVHFQPDGNGSYINQRLLQRRSVKRVGPSKSFRQSKQKRRMSYGATVGRSKSFQQSKRKSRMSYGAPDQGQYFHPIPGPSGQGAVGRSVSFRQSKRMSATPYGEADHWQYFRPIQGPPPRVPHRPLEAMPSVGDGIYAQVHDGIR